MSTPFDPASLDAAALSRTIARFAGQTLAVLGDCMVDRYLWGRVDRISPEAPVPVVEIERESVMLGGAGNVAANLLALGATARLIGAIGDDAEGELLRRAFAGRGVDTRSVITDATRPTTVKTRVIAHAQQVVRTDRESRADLSGAAQEALLRALERELDGCAGLIVSDYGKGVVNAAALGRALEIARARGIAVSVDPKESHIDAYRGVRLLTPNQHEAGAIQGRRVTDEPSLLEVGWGLRQRLDAEAVLITRGAGGMSLFERSGRLTHLPTVARDVYDVTGAGDTVVSVAALALAAGAEAPLACHLANHAAGVVIREVGTACCTPDQLRASLGI